MMEIDNDYLERQYKSTKVIGFKLGEVELAINIKFVQEVVPIADIRKIPRSPIFIEGVFSHRDEIIPVVDLRRFLWIRPNTNKQARVIVYNLKQVKIGFIVDEVYSVIKLETHMILPPAPVKIKGLPDDCIHGLFDYNDKNILLIDLGKLFSAKEEEIINKVTKEV